MQFWFSSSTAQPQGDKETPPPPQLSSPSSSSLSSRRRLDSAGGGGGGGGAAAASVATATLSMIANTSSSIHNNNTTSSFIWHEVTIDVLGIAGIPASLTSSSSSTCPTTSDLSSLPTLQQLVSSSSSGGTGGTGTGGRTVRAVVAVVHNRKSHGTSGLSEPLRVVSTPSFKEPFHAHHHQQQKRYVALWNGSSSSSASDRGGGGGGKRRSRGGRFPSTVSFDAKLRSSATEKIDLMVSLVDCCSETTAAVDNPAKNTRRPSSASASVESSSYIRAVPVGVCSFRIAAAEWRQTNKLILDIPFHYLQQSSSKSSSSTSASSNNTTSHYRHPQCRDFPDVRVRKSDLPCCSSSPPRRRGGGNEPAETMPLASLPSSPPPRRTSSGGLTLRRMFSNTSRETKKLMNKDRRDDDVDDSKSATSSSSVVSDEAALCDGSLMDYLKTVPVQEGLVRLEIQWKRKDVGSVHSAAEHRECADHPQHGLSVGGGPSICSSKNDSHRPSICSSSKNGSHRGGSALSMSSRRHPDFSSARNLFPAVVAATAAAAAARPSSPPPSSVSKMMVESMSKSSNNNDAAAHKGNQDKATTATTFTMKQDASPVASEEQQQQYPGLIEAAASFGSGFFSISTKGDSEFGGPNYYCPVPGEGQDQQQQDQPPTILDPAKIDIGGRRQQQQQQDNKVSSTRQSPPPPAQEPVTSSTQEARASTGCMESSFCALSDSFGLNDIDDDDDVNTKNESGKSIVKIVGIDPSTIGVLDKNSKSNNSSPQSVMSSSNAGTGVEMETNRRGFARVAGEASVEQRSQTTTCSPCGDSSTVHHAASKSAASASSSCSNALPSLRPKSPTRFYESTPHSSSNNSAQSKENEPNNNNNAGLSPSSSVDAVEKALWPFNLSSRGQRSTSPSRDEDAGFEVSLVRAFSDTNVQTAPTTDRSTTRFTDMDSRAQSSHPHQPSTPDVIHHRFSALNLRSMDKSISFRAAGVNSPSKKNIMDQHQERSSPPTAKKSSNFSNSKGSTTMNSLFSSVGAGLGYPLTTSFTRSSSSNKSGSGILADKEQKAVGGILRNRSPSETAHKSNVKSAFAPPKGQNVATILATSRKKFSREQSADTYTLSEMSSPNSPYTSDWQWFMRDILMFPNKNEGSNTNTPTTTKPQKSVRFHPSVRGTVESAFCMEESIDESRRVNEYDDDSDWNTVESKETNNNNGNNSPLWMRVMNKLVYGRSQESDGYQGRSSYPPQTGGAITRYLPRVERSDNGSDWIPNLDWVGSMPGILDRDDHWTNYEDDSTWGTLETKESLARPRDDMSLVPLPEDFLYHETYYGCGMRIAKYYDRIFEDNGHGYRGRRQPVPIILLNDMLDERSIQHTQGFDDTSLASTSLASSRGHGPVSI